jgi:host factor-I protein
MTPDADDDLQTRMLASFQKSEVQVFIFLVNGIKLTGRIASFDKYTIGLESPTGIQTVYKRAVSTVSEAHVVLPRTGDVRPRDVTSPSGPVAQRRTHFGGQTSR